jgi:alcohol dehydrogenase (NADP+)
MPTMSFGVSRIPKSETKSRVISAIQAGFTHIDTAAVYGNESEVGEALNELFTSGEKRREEIFITTKCFISRYRKVREALIYSLQRLQVTYVDQYLLHWPFATEPTDIEPPPFVEKPKLDRYPLHLVWAQMEQVKQEGLVRSIGVSNWTVALLNDMFGYANIIPDINQLEINPYNKRVELVEFCQQNSILPVAYRVIYGSKLDHLTNLDKCIMDDPVVLEISRKHGRSPAQVLIAWCLSRKCAVICKTLNESRMRENLESRNLVLDDEDIEKINAIPDQGTYLDPSKFYGFNIFK